MLVETNSYYTTATDYGSPLGAYFREYLNTPIPDGSLDWRIRAHCMDLLQEKHAPHDSALRVVSGIACESLKCLLPSITIIDIAPEVKYFQPSTKVYIHNQMDREYIKQTITALDAAISALLEFNPSSYNGAFSKQQMLSMMLGYQNEDGVPWSESSQEIQIEETARLIEALSKIELIFAPKNLFYEQMPVPVQTILKSRWGENFWVMNATLSGEFGTLYYSDSAESKLKNKKALQKSNAEHELVHFITNKLFSYGSLNGEPYIKSADTYMAPWVSEGLCNLAVLRYFSGIKIDELFLDLDLKRWDASLPTAQEIINAIQKHRIS